MLGSSGLYYWGCIAPRTDISRGNHFFRRSSYISKMWHYLGTTRAVVIDLSGCCWCKKVQPIRRKEGIKVRPKPPSLLRQGGSGGLLIKATHRAHVWTWNFIIYRTDRGSAFEMLTMLDEYAENV